MNLPITILLKKNGSIKIPGPIVLIDEDGNETLIEKEIVSLCRCGASKEMPLCDSTHRTIGFECPGTTIKLAE